MKKLFLLLGLTLPVTLGAQSYRAPAGGGEYKMSQGVCVTPEEAQRIQQMLQSQIQLLKQEGKLPADWGRESAHKPGGAGGFIWPVKKKDGLPHNSVYGISNFVDHNLIYPNQLQDWNCGERTYDLTSGYNHAGVDIYTWPFGQNMQQDDDAEIIAAADGIIIAKEDNHSDHSCAMSGAVWNAVYVGHPNGTITWYGHMKKNSLTAKLVGETVTQGEFLGIVGSSGNSTGPHLHFEVHDGDGNVIDPYHGDCSSGPSLWLDQKPYYDPAINLLMTHSAPPVFPACPALESKHAKDTFTTGDELYVGSYLRDQQNQIISYQLLAPDGSVFDDWTHNLTPGLYYSSSYWYWLWTVSDGWPSGEYHFTGSFAGSTFSHPFYVTGTGTGIAATAGSGSHLSVYPNPAKDQLNVSGLPDGVLQVRIINLPGQALQSLPVTTTQGKASIKLQLPPGSYLLLLQQEDGTVHRTRFSIAQ